MDSGRAVQSIAEAGIIASTAARAVIFIAVAASPQIPRIGHAQPQSAAHRQSVMTSPLSGVILCILQGSAAVGVDCFVCVRPAATDAPVVPIA